MADDSSDDGSAQQQLDSVKDALSGDWSQRGQDSAAGEAYAELEKEAGQLEGVNGISAAQALAKGSQNPKYIKQYTDQANAEQAELDVIKENLAGNWSNRGQNSVSRTAYEQLENAETSLAKEVPATPAGGAANTVESQYETLQKQMAPGVPSSMSKSITAYDNYDKKLIGKGHGIGEGGEIAATLVAGGVGAIFTGGADLPETAAAVSGELSAGGASEGTTLVVEGANDAKQLEAGVDGAKALSSGPGTDIELYRGGGELAVRETGNSIELVNSSGATVRTLSLVDNGVAEDVGTSTLKKLAVGSSVAVAGGVITAVAAGKGSDGKEQVAYKYVPKGSAASATDAASSSVSNSVIKTQLKAPDGGDVQATINSAGEITANGKVIADYKDGKITYTTAGKEMLGADFRDHAYLASASQGPAVPPADAASASVPTPTMKTSLKAGNQTMEVSVSSSGVVSFGNEVIGDYKDGKITYNQAGKSLLGQSFTEKAVLLTSPTQPAPEYTDKTITSGAHVSGAAAGSTGSTNETTKPESNASSGTRGLPSSILHSAEKGAQSISAGVTKSAKEVEAGSSTLSTDSAALNKAEANLKTVEGEKTSADFGAADSTQAINTKIDQAQKAVTTADDNYKAAESKASAVAAGNIKGYDAGATYQADERDITKLKTEETKDLKGTDVTDDNTVPLANQISKEEASAKTALSVYETDKTANALSTVKTDDSKGPAVASDITDKSVSVEDLYKSSGMTKKEFFDANPALSIHYNESTGDITGSVGDKTIVYVDQTKNDAFLKDLSGSVKADTLSSSSGGSSTTSLGSNTGSITTSSSTTANSNSQQQQLQAAISKDSAEETAYASDMAADHTAAETAGGNKVGAMNKLKRDTASGDGKLILEEDQEQVTKWTNEQAKDNAQATTDTNNYKNALQAYNTDEAALNPGTANTQTGGSPADGSSSTDTTTATTSPGSNTGSTATSGGSASSAAQQQLQSDEALVNQYTAAVQTDRTNLANDNQAVTIDHADAKTDGGNKVGATNRLVGDEATGESKKILAADSAEVTKWTNAQAQENAKAAQDTASAAAAGQQLQNDSSSLDVATAAVKQDEANIANPGTANTQTGGSPADGSSSTDTTTATTSPGSNDPTAGTNPTGSNTGGNGTASSSDPSSGGSTNEVIVNLQNQITQDQSSVATLQNEVSQYNSAAQTDQANISQDSAAASAAYASEQSYNNAVATDHYDAKTDGGNKVGATNRLVGDEATGESKKILAADSAEVTKWTNAQAQENAKAAQDTASAAAAANQYNIAESNLSAATTAFTSDNNNSAAATSQLNAANQTLASDQASLQQQESAFLSSSNYSNMQSNLPTSGSANVPTTGGQTSPPPPDVTTAVVPAAKQ